MSQITVIKAEYDAQTGAIAWAMHRGTEGLFRAGTIDAGTPDPLRSLRLLELRSGALDVELRGATLTPMERTYALAKGWTLR